jgi:glycosyltransferase involved in cell wall biosynthesis
LKSGIAGRLWHALSERVTLALADRAVADARAIDERYRATHGAELAVIAYGGDHATPVAAGPALARFGLRPDRYFIQTGRLEPENHALLAVRAFARVPGDLRLVIVGDAPYAHATKRALAAAAARDPRVVLAGAVYGRRYRELVSNAFAAIASGDVGGTHPALLEAMALAPAVVANDVPEHREVLGDAGLFYERNDEVALARELARLAVAPEARAELGAAARARVRERYRWDQVVTAYEELFRKVLS